MTGDEEEGLLFLIPSDSGPDIPCPILNNFPAHKEVMVPQWPDREGIMLIVPKSLFSAPW